MKRTLTALVLALLLAALPLLSGCKVQETLLPQFRAALEAAATRSEDESAADNEAAWNTAPEPTSEAAASPTPVPTPELTPEPTPEAAPEPTPEASPEPTPGLSDWSPSV